MTGSIGVRYIECDGGNLIAVGAKSDRSVARNPVLLVTSLFPSANPASARAQPKPREVPGISRTFFESDLALPS